MADEEQQLAERRNQPAPLKRWERVLAGGVGGVFTIAGGYAVLVLGKDGAGSLALIAVGALFLLISAVAVFPTRFKLGSSEVTVHRSEAERYALRKVEEAQERAAGGDREGAMQALEAVATPPEPELTLRPPFFDFADARNEVLNYARRWARSVGGDLVLNERTPYVAYVVMGNKRVALELQHLAFEPDVAIRVANYMPDFVGAVTGIVIIFRRDPWEYSGAIKHIEGIVSSEYNVPVRSVLWGGNDRFAQLELALGALLNLPPGSPP